MFHVLLIEDSMECQLVTKRALAGSGIDLTCASTLIEALTCISDISRRPIDLILLDRCLPDGDGMTVLEELHMLNLSPSPSVFLLTSTGEISSKVTAFGLGAEDYLVKPVNPLELRARIERMHKKKNHKWAQTLVKGELFLDLALMRAFIVSAQGREQLDLTGKQFKILLFLAQNEGKAFVRHDLVKAVWGESLHILDRTVDSHIYGLRKKLMHLSHYIECIPHLGYRFVVSASASRSVFKEA